MEFQSRRVSESNKEDKAASRGGKGKGELQQPELHHKESVNTGGGTAQHSIQCWMCQLKRARCEIISENWARVRRPKMCLGFPGAKKHELFILRNHTSFGKESSKFVPELVKSVGIVHESIQPSFKVHFHVHGFGEESPPAISYKRWPLKPDFCRAI